MFLFYPFVIKTQENNEIVVPNSVMASQESYAWFCVMHDTRPDDHLEGSSPGRYSWETGQESLNLSNPRRGHDEIVWRD
jgi:hypothetical protein